MIDMIDIFDGKTDLHMHSNASDGTDSVPELLEKVKHAGITTFSLTDHDTIEGSLKMEKIVPDGMRFIRGVEFSCRTKLRKCHILGYDYDTQNQAFLDTLEASAAVRKNKNKMRIQHLEERYGIRITEEEIAYLNSLDSAGKPQLARMIMQRGLASSINEAIEKYLNSYKSTPYDSGLAIQGIRTGGGTAVWAHPLGGEREKPISEEQVEEQLEILLEQGLQGLECRYSRYTREQSEMLRRLAKKYDLLMTGGSDYHGATKHNITPGQLEAPSRDI